MIITDKLTSSATIKEIISDQETQNTINICITKNKNKINEKKRKELEVLFNSINKSIDKKNTHYNNTNYEIIEISYSIIIISIYLKDKLSDKSIKNLLTEISEALTKRNVSIPNQSKLYTEINKNTSSLYLTEVQENISKIIDTLSSSPRTQRKEINNLLSVIHFIKDDKNLKQSLEHHIKTSTSRTDIDTETKSRIIDSCSYLLFELTSKDETNQFGEFLSKESTNSPQSGNSYPMLSRGFRHSFLKGIKVLDHSPNLYDLIKHTNNADAISFSIIKKVISSSPSQETASNSELEVINNLNKLSRDDIKLLAKDLRRTVPEKNQIINQKIINECTAFINNSENNEDRICRYLVLHYLGYLNAKMIASHVHKDAILSENEKLSLSAISGYDTQYTIQLNKHLIDNELTATIQAPSKHKDIKKYMETTIEKWTLNIGKTASQNLDALEKHHQPLVSVIITTYNPDIRLFELSLKSIIHQTYKRLEIIIIYNCSASEKSIEITKAIDKQLKESPHEIIYKRNDHNSGQYYSRNEAIKISKGEFISIQDDDDISHPERIASQISPMLTSKEIMATHSNHIRISENSRWMIDGNTIGEIPGDAPVSFIWRKAVFQEIGYFLHTKTRGDIEFRTRMQHKYNSNAIKEIPLPLVIMRGGLNTISSDKEYFFKTALNALRYFMVNPLKRQSNTIEPNFINDERWIPVLLK